MASYSADDFFPRYKLVSDDSWSDALNQRWNKYVKEYDLPFRNFHVGAHSSISSRTRWMHWYLIKNRRKLGFHYEADAEDVYETFTTVLMLACAKVQELGCERAGEGLERPYDERITLWRFIDPIDNLLWLAGFSEDPPEEIQRRKHKAQLLKEFNADMKDFIKQAVYLSGSDKHSNQRLAQALELARQALAQAEDDLRWVHG